MPAAVQVCSHSVAWPRTTPPGSGITVPQGALSDRRKAGLVAETTTAVLDAAGLTDADAQRVWVLIHEQPDARGARAGRSCATRISWPSPRSRASPSADAASPVHGGDGFGVSQDQGRRSRWFLRWRPMTGDDGGAPPSGTWTVWAGTKPDRRTLQGWTESRARSVAGELGCCQKSPPSGSSVRIPVRASSG
jgi:phenylpyruvate tautomerase PptA (4-oxalocrotonate tautomerase family)